MVDFSPEDGGISSKMLVLTYNLTQHHNPEDQHEHLHCHKISHMSHNNHINHLFIYLISTQMSSSLNELACNFMV
jgi:hypothetical protein